MLLTRLHRPLMLTAAIMTILALVSAAGLILDDRTLLGAPIWLKPLKFSISLAIYSVTLGWLISLAERKQKTAYRLGVVIALGAVIEQVVIVGQTVRGRPSHFNAATPLDMTLFSIMGVTIVMVWLATVWIAVLLMIQRLPDRATALAIRLGLVIALGGLGMGFLMTSPTSEQLKQLEAGAAPSLLGAHSVGVPDGGPGLALVNWSTEGGDLRVGHFVGMHALQALPLFAFALVLLSRRFGRLRDGILRSRLIVLVAVAYAAVTSLTVWQALRGQPLTRPDALTLSMAAAIAAVTAVGIIVAFLRHPAVPPTAGTASTATAGAEATAAAGVR